MFIIKFFVWDIWVLLFSIIIYIGLLFGLFLVFLYVWLVSSFELFLTDKKRG